MDFDPNTVPKLNRKITIGERLQNYSEQCMIKVASTPVGQYSLQRVDQSLYVLEKTLEWSIPEQSENVNSAKGDTYQHKTEKKKKSYFFFTIPPHLVRPLPWILFLPFLFYLKLCHFYLNTIVVILGIEKIQYEDVVHKLQNVRRDIRAIKYSGIRNIRMKEKIATERYRNNEIQLNIVCRVFSKWPLSVFVTRLRKILNFLGLITLPRPRHVHRQATKVRRVNEPSKDAKQRKPEQNDLSRDSNVATTVLTNENLASDTDEEDYEPSTEVQSSDTSEEDSDTQPENVSGSSRVSVTVQEVIQEETEEESVNKSQDAKDSDKQDSVDTFFSPLNSKSVSPEPVTVQEFLNHMKETSDPNPS